VLRGLVAETDRTIRIRASFGTITSPGSEYVRMQGHHRISAAVTNNLDVQASASTQNLTAAIPAGDDFNWDLVVKDWGWGFETGGAESEIQHLVLVMKSIVTSRFELATIPQRYVIRPDDWRRYYP